LAKAHSLRIVSTVIFLDRLDYEAMQEKIFNFCSTNFEEICLRYGLKSALEGLWNGILR